MKATKKARKVATLAMKVPTIGERIDRLERWLTLTEKAFRPFGKQDSETEVREVSKGEARVLMELIEEAQAQAWWLTRLPDDVRDLPAPDDDQAEAMERA